MSYSQHISRYSLLKSLECIEKKHMGSEHDALINYHNYAAYIKMKLGPRMGQRVKDKLLHYMRQLQGMLIWRENQTLNLNSMMSPSLTT